MATRTQTRTRTDNRKHAYRGNESVYVYGNTARKLDVKTVIEEKKEPQLSHAVRKNRDKAEHMNPGYVLFLSLALVVTAVMLISYIKLQSEITQSVKSIARLESQLNSQKLENDEEYSRITSSVDLEEIKRIAIEELGMRYAEEGQVVVYSSEGNDYVRQLADVKTAK